MLRTVDLAHAEKSDEVFSLYWTGHRDYLVRRDYPEWIALCQRIVSAFDSDHFQTVPSELAIKFGFAKESKIIDTHSSLYRQNYDIDADRQDDKPKGDPEQLKDELMLWNLKSIRKLLVQYMALRIATRDKSETLNLDAIKRKLVNEFAKLLVDNIINPVCDKFQYTAHRITTDQFESFENSINGDFSFLLKNQNNESVINQIAITGNAVFVKDEPLNMKRLANDIEPVSALEDTQKIIDDVVKIGTPSLGVQGYISPAGVVIEEVKDDLPFVSEEKVQSYTTTNLGTPILLALGAIAGVVTLGVVIAATHGIALPFIAGVGVTILAGHGGAAAGMAVGCSLFGLAAATLGGGISYAAKKTYDLFNWCCCSKQLVSEHDGMRDYVQGKEVKRSPSTSSLLTALSDAQHDYKSTQSSREDEVLSPLLSSNDSPRDHHPANSRFGKASLFSSLDDKATQRLSSESAPQYHQKPGHQS